jgi:hypothetical protein
MKKLIALFTAMAFALTLGVAFAEEKAAAPMAPEKKMEEKAPAKKEKKKSKKDKKKASKKEMKETAPMAPAAPAAPAGK